MNLGRGKREKVSTEARFYRHTALPIYERATYLVTDAVLALAEVETVFLMRAAREERRDARATVSFSHVETIAVVMESQEASLRRAMVRNSLMSLISLGC